MKTDVEILQLENRLWLLTRRVGVPIYDFDFRQWFVARSPMELPDGINAIARIGAIADYNQFYAECREDGIQLIHSPDEYHRASQLDGWYPLLEDLTPESVWFKGQPTLEQVKARFDWPVFMKGARQTSRHQRKLSLIESDADFVSAMDAYAKDSILAWQDIVCRKFIPLRSVAGADADPNKLPRSFEFRTFWWKGQLGGAGRYWWEGPNYDWNAVERAAGLAVAAEAARRVNVPFLVVDIAQAADGRWIVIECNDGQESGYAGVSPFGLWQKILDLEMGQKDL